MQKNREDCRHPGKARRLDWRRAFFVCVCRLKTEQADRFRFLSELIPIRE
jgi:hypothetical protein